VIKEQEKCNQAATNNRLLAFMATDVKTQTLVLRKSYSDYSDESAFEPSRQQAPNRSVS
jgi:hypothetical protein